MIFYGFSVRHYQMIEAGRPITVFTLLRVCEAFGISPEQLVAGLGQRPRKRKKKKIENASTCDSRQHPGEMAGG
jgi:hypothetical protein